MDRQPGRREKRPAPFSIRFTDAERAVLVARAGQQSVASYIKRRVLDDGATGSRRHARSVTPDLETLARCLATLGKSGLGDSLARLARLAEIGALYTDPETLAALRRACDDVRAIRGLLMQALGKETGDSLSRHFNDRAGDPER